MLSFPKVVFALLAASALAKPPATFLRESTEPEAPTTALASSSGQCTAADIELLKVPGSIPDGPKSLGALQDTCGHQAYSWFTFHQDTFETCFQKTIANVSDNCVKCFNSAQYAANNCKSACALWGNSWCSQGCLDCVSTQLKEEHACAGYNPAVPKAC